MKECPSCHLCLEDQYPVCPHDGAPLDMVFDGSPILDGKYRLVRRLGGGGVGRVYKARHLRLERLCSVKVLRPRLRGDEATVRRFEGEAEALGRLGHPNVVDVTDFGVDRPREVHYLVMEYLEGVSLDERLRTEGPFPLEDALPIFEQVAGALDHAHATGILHRDLKPANVLLLDAATAPKVKLLDFGLARFFTDLGQTLELTAPQARPATSDDARRETNEALTTDGVLVGTPGYVAPEVQDGRPPTPAADLWAFGALIHATLLGRPPSPGPLSPRGDRGGETLSGRLDAELDELILAALATDPAARPGTGEELVAGFRKAAHRAVRRRWRRRESPLRLVLAVLFGLVAALGVVVFGPLLAGVEDRLTDLRFFLAPPRSGDFPLLLVLIDDATLESDPTALVDKADETGRLLAQVLERDAAGVGLDLLLPESWNRSAAFTRLVVRHSEALALAAFSPPDGPVMGTAAVDGLATAALGPARIREVFGFVNLDEDGDGVVRRARASYRVDDGQTQPSFAARLAQILLEDRPKPRQPGTFFRIDFTFDHRQIERISWQDLTPTLEREPERFRDRLVLVGAGFTGSGDGHRVPHPRGMPGEVPGLVLQALTLTTLLEETPVRETPRGPTLLAAALLATLAAGSVLLTRPLAVALSPGLVATLGWSAAAYAGFARDRMLLGVAPFVATLLLILVTAFVLRRRMSAFPDPLPGA